MEKASFNVFLATIALSILAFLPSTVVSLAVVKIVIIGVGILLSLFLYAISRLKEGSLSLPLHPIVWIGGLLGIATIVSVVLSASPINSFANINFDQYGGAFTLIVLVAGLLAVLLCRTRERIASVVVTIIGSFVLAALFALVRVLIPGIASGALGLGTFSTLTSTMVGSWYDLAILTGIVFLISSFTLESFSTNHLPVSKRLRVISIVLCVVSFIVLFLIDLSLIWIGIALAALGLLAYRFFSAKKTKVSENNASENKEIKSKSYKSLPYFALIMFVIAALFAWKGNLVAGPVIQKLNISYAEVSLPWQSTLDVAYPTLRHSTLSTLFGAGPDRFAEQYLLYKPAGINQTQFWSVAFPNGHDFILTSLVDTGVIGCILWILLFGWFIAIGVRSMCRPPENHLSKYMLTTTFLTTFFLWCMLFLYTPSHAIIFITLIMTGLFLSVFSIEMKGVKMLEVREIGWSRGWKEGRAVWIVLWLVILISAIGCLLYVKDAVSEGYFQSGINASAAGNVSASRADFEKALSLKKSDTYYQALAQIDSYQINSIISSATAASSSAISTIGSLLNEGIGFARSGQRIDPRNADNFLAEGDLSSIAAALNVPNAYADGRGAYIYAINLSPMNPAIYLSLGRLDYAEGSTTAAVAEISDALQLKPDYTDALFEAGVISYNAKNYQTAAQAFESVLKVDRTYANAEYFLGLTFARANDTADAVTVFTDLSKSYPQNATISTILTDLQNGVSIFSSGNQSSAPTVGSAPSGSASPAPAPKVSALSKPATSVKDDTKTKKAETSSTSSDSTQ
jgi:tetratricopeptide (TPR) repeat protein